ncbi:MAG: hypothetical protein HFG15_05155 [Bacilli bacterium]|jgi:hypothetical protein|nr:hypothetical protein [Bacilli bacterium]
MRTDEELRGNNSALAKIQQRKAMFEQMKREIEELTGHQRGHNVPFADFGESGTIDENQDSIISSNYEPPTEGYGNNNNNEKSFTKATAIGRAMSENREQGYVSALMLGVISFIVEILFLAIMFWLLK